MKLRIYSVVLELVREVAPVLSVLRGRSKGLADQFERALTNRGAESDDCGSRRYAASAARGRPWRLRVIGV